MSIELSKPSIDIGIITRDAGPMLAFYRDTLGLEFEGTIPMPSGGDMHRLKVGGSVLKIVQLSRAPQADAAPGGIPAATGCRYWTLTVKDLEKSVQVCSDGGYKVAVPPKVIRPGVAIAMVEDPDGNWVELLQNG